MTDNAILLKNLHNSQGTCEAELVKNNMGLIIGIAKRYTARGYDMEELIQIGSIGLIKAIRKFDESFNVQFSTYAVPMIIGEIKRFIRDDGMIKVSRTHKANAAKARHAQQILSQRLNREPTISEICTECNISHDEFIEAMEATAPLESINYSAGCDDDERELSEKLGTVEEEGKIINRVIIKESLGVLNPRERKVIALRYFSQKTQNQISDVIGVSQVQISRIEKAALQKLRNFLKAE